MLYVLIITEFYTEVLPGLFFFKTLDYIKDYKNLCAIVQNRLSLYHQVARMTKLPFSVSN